MEYWIRLIHFILSRFTLVLFLSCFIDNVVSMNLWDSVSNKCLWPGCYANVKSHEEFAMHLHSDHSLNTKTELQVKTQLLMIEQLDKLVR
jgi:hypothetical protein